MSRPIPRVEENVDYVDFSPVVLKKGMTGAGKILTPSSRQSVGVTKSVLWTSEGHPIGPSGHRESGGPFYVTHDKTFLRPGHVDSVIGGNNLELEYSGPVIGSFVSTSEMDAKHGEPPPSKMNESSLNSLGATAIAQCAPTNPTANLATTLAETFREGIPSLPGIQSWKKRTEAAKAAGSEYLNYIFGWKPLTDEVHSVVKAARQHRDIMQNYRHNEGSNVHRRFDFPSEHSVWSATAPPYALNANVGPTGNSSWWTSPEARRTVRVESTRKRWFEGCFTYGGPSGADNFRRAIGFGSEADAVYGLNLTPDTLWELTPWSWAVDWFSNAGDVIHNVSSFAAAGLVMRYGYMMEETINTLYVDYSDGGYRIATPGKPGSYTNVQQGACSIGRSYVSKARCPANPFGFGIGWEGLSPTQLAITAAIGITRLL